IQIASHETSQQLISTNGSAVPAKVSTSETAPKQLSFLLQLLRRFFFEVMLPSRLVLSLVFAGLKIYQRSGLQTLMHRTGLLNAVNALPTPFQDKLIIPEALMDKAKGN